MSKLPLSAFDDLALNEIKHIVDVMRDADVDENEDEINDNNNTIKRSPLPISLPIKPHKTKKKEQQNNIYENIDTNNNTLKRNNTHDNSSNSLKSKQDRTSTSTSSNGIPSVPRVHMGAGFMKIFNQCPLEIHASCCWINNETRGKIVVEI
jgi:hypothetical protein